MISIDDEKIRVYRKSIGMFAIIDYKIPNRCSCAKGRLESVTDDSIIIKHLYNNKIWIINISDIINSKFSVIRGDQE